MISKIIHLEFYSVVYNHDTRDLPAAYTLVVIQPGVFGPSARFPFADSPLNRICVGRKYTVKEVTWILSLGWRARG